MSGPEHVRVKRKRGDPAPDALIVERPGKKNKQAEADSTCHYVLRKHDGADGGIDAAHGERRAAHRPCADGHGERPSAAQATARPKAAGNGAPSLARERRVFHLNRPTTPEPGVRKRAQARIGGDEGVATFVERRVRPKVAQRLEGVAARDRSASLSVSRPLPAAPYKRPGKGAAVRVSRDAPSVLAGAHARSDSRVEIMADALHQFAVDEAARGHAAQVHAAGSKPKVTAMPKLSGQRSQAIHQQRASLSSPAWSRASAVEEASVDEDADYVYDTYVLAPSSHVGAVQVDTADGSVGYLIIGEEDEAVWETYMEEDSSDDEPSDEDDENAEHWYGADYPDDELASDDEYGRNAYGYRAAASDDEEYDEHTRSDDELERPRDPWHKKTPQHFQRYFGGVNGEDES